MKKDSVYYLQGVGGNLCVYPDKVIIERKGFTAFSLHGVSGDKTIPISSIKSIQFSKTTMMSRGYIQFGILGGKEAHGGAYNAARDENSILIKFGDDCLAQSIVNYINEQMYEIDNPHTDNTNQISPADEIRKYRELFDEGIITQEEFNKKKKQLLEL